MERIGAGMGHFLRVAGELARRICANTASKLAGYTNTHKSTH
jgi:hypothetical protein